MTKGYIYPMFRGADPGKGWHMTDPIFGRVPTIGACMPNIRRLVVPGDYIFVISGKVPHVQQYVVGGFKVAEKINALAAYKRFPNNHLLKRPDGSLSGNIIVNEDGTQSPLDYHKNFEKRVSDYIIGDEPLCIDKPHEIELAREQTLEVLGRVLNQKGTQLSEVVSRWRKLNAEQVQEMLVWLRGLKDHPLAR